MPLVLKQVEYTIAKIWKETSNKFFDCDASLPKAYGGRQNLLLTSLGYFGTDKKFEKYCKWRMGFPGGAIGKESTCCRRYKRLRFELWVGKIRWSRKWQPISAFLTGKSHGQRSLAGYGPWGHKKVDMTEHACSKWRIEPKLLAFANHLIHIYYLNSLLFFCSPSTQGSRNIASYFYLNMQSCFMRKAIN